MRKVSLVSGLMLSFVLGCVASRVAVPNVRAGTPSPSAARWEYMCVDAYGGVTHSANQLGREGWEMAAAAGTSDHMMWCFKRLLP